MRRLNQRPAKQVTSNSSPVAVLVPRSDNQRARYADECPDQTTAGRATGRRIRAIGQHGNIERSVHDGARGQGKAAVVMICVYTA